MQLLNVATPSFAIFWFKVTVSNDLQPSKVCEPILWSAIGNASVLSLVQSLNASSWILVNVLGKLIFSNDVHSKNAWNSIFSTFPNTNSFTLLQPLNVLFFITVIFWGSVTVPMILLQLINAPSSIVVTDDGIIKEVNWQL